MGETARRVSITITHGPLQRYSNQASCAPTKNPRLRTGKGGNQLLPPPQSMAVKGAGVGVSGGRGGTAGGGTLGLAKHVPISISWCPYHTTVPDFLQLVSRRQEVPACPSHLSPCTDLVEIY